MAFWAGIDGTWSRDELGPEDDTNVVRMMRLSGQATYHPGVSGPLGGLFGLGGKRRIRSALTAWERAGRPPAYLVGWSRGAAAVVNLAWRIHELGGTVAWIGLLDAVRWLGLPGGWEWGYSNTLPPGAPSIHVLGRSGWFRRTRYPEAHEVFLDASHAEVGGKKRGEKAALALMVLRRHAAKHGAELTG